MNARSSSLGTFLLAVVAAVGCGEVEPITTTETPLTKPREAPLTVEAVRNTLDHMLVAIVPAKDVAWFFKLEAPGSRVEAVREPFGKFVASIKPSAGAAAPTWTLPEGWVEKPASEMRAATIEVPVDGGVLELAVSQLPYSGEWDGFLRMNVNRWMGQLQQQPLPAEKIAELARKTPLDGGGEATVIELVGLRDRSTAGMPPGHPPVAAAPRGRESSPATTVESTAPGSDPALTPAPTAAAKPAEEPASPASDTPATAAAQAGSNPDFKYETPAGWQPGPLNSMRRAAFVMTEGDGKAEMTVMPFPANPVMSDPIAQAERWAGQVGLQLSQDEVKKLEQKVVIDGVEGQQFELAGPADGEKPQAALAAMIARDGQVWFFKLMGDRPVVEAQRESFAKFLQSVEFNR
jgi:hypothetical protein